MVTVTVTVTVTGGTMARHRPNVGAPLAYPIGIRRKTVVGIFSIALAVSAAAQVVSVFGQGKAPQQILSIFPKNARANSLLSEIAMTKIADNPGIEATVEEAASTSLSSQALNPVAMRQLALVSLLRNDERSATERFAFAERMSKRDIGTHLYQHEIAFRRGQFGEAIEQLDRGARSSQKARPILLQRGVATLDNEEWRSLMASKLREAPNWAADFWAMVLADESKVSESAALRSKLPASGGNVVSDKVTRAILRNLLRDNLVTETVSLYYALEGSERVQSAMQGNTSFVSGQLPGLGWESTADVDHITKFEDDGNRMSYAVLPGAEQALLARRLVALNPGNYRASIDVIKATARPEMTLIIRCGESDIELAKLSLGTTGTKQADFRIRADCPIQWMRLVSAPNLSQELQSGSISKIIIETQ